MMSGKFVVMNVDDIKDINGNVIIFKFEFY